MKLSARKYIDNQIRWVEKVEDAEITAIGERCQRVKRAGYCPSSSQQRLTEKNNSTGEEISLDNCLKCLEKYNMESEDKVSLKQYFDIIIKEGDKRFDERLNSIEKLINNNSKEAKEAVKAALDAQEKAINVALTATKEANVKAEIAADKRFDSLNSNFTESLSIIRTELASLRESRSKIHGKEEAQYQNNEQSNWSTGVIITAILSSAAIIISILNVLK